MTEDSESIVSPSRLNCFVIGPIGDSLAPHGSEERLRYEEALEVYEEIVRPACEAVGLHSVRADEISQVGDITNQVFRRLRDDDVVIADVSDGNPNVMYELGLRHTQDKLTLQIGEYGRLPFDIAAIRTVLFSRSKRGLINARNELTDLLRAGLAGEYDPVSATRAWHSDRKSMGEPEQTSVVEESELDEELGFLDLVAQMELAMPTFTEAVEKAGTTINRIGELTLDVAKKVEENDAAGGSMGTRLAIVMAFARALDEPAEELTSVAQIYATSLGDIHSGMDAMLQAIEDDPDLLAEAGEFPTSVRELAAITRDSMQGLNQLAAAIKDASRSTVVMRPPANKINDALTVFADASAVMDDWDRRLQALGVPTPEMADADEAGTPE